MLAKRSTLVRAAALLPSTAKRLAVANLEQSSSNEHNDNDNDGDNDDVEKKNTSEETAQSMDTLDDDTAEPIDWNTSGQSGVVSKEKQADADEVYGNFKALVDKDNDDNNTDDVYASVSAALQTDETKDDEDTSSHGRIESKPRNDYDSMPESLQAPPLPKSLQASPLSESLHAPPLPPLSVSGVAALNQMWSTLEIDINNVDVSVFYYEFVCYFVRLIYFRFNLIEF